MLILYYEPCIQVRNKFPNQIKTADLPLEVYRNFEIINLEIFSSFSTLDNFRKVDQINWKLFLLHM